MLAVEGGLFRPDEALQAPLPLSVCGEPGAGKARQVRPREVQELPQGAHRAASLVEFQVNLCNLGLEAPAESVVGRAIDRPLERVALRQVLPLPLERLEASARRAGLALSLSPRCAGFSPTSASHRSSPSRSAHAPPDETEL